MTNEIQEFGIGSTTVKLHGGISSYCEFTEMLKSFRDGKSKEQIEKRFGKVYCDKRYAIAEDIWNKRHKVRTVEVI